MKMIFGVPWNVLRLVRIVDIRNVSYWKLTGIQEIVISTCL